MYLEDAFHVIQFNGNNENKNITHHIVHSYFFVYHCNKRSRTNFVLHIMKINENICTSHIIVEKVWAILTKMNEIYATICRLVKAHLAGIVLKNHSHVFIETNCYPSTFLEKNDHTYPIFYLFLNDLCTHTITHLLAWFVIGQLPLNTSYLVFVLVE